MLLLKEKLLRTVILQYLLLCMMLLAGSWYLFAEGRAHDLKEATADLQTTLNVTQETLADVLNRNQKILEAFFSARAEQLKQLALGHHAAQLDQLTDQLRRIMPTVFAINVIGPDGRLVVPDFDGSVGDICLEDTRAALFHGQSMPRLHPNVLGLHYDIYYRFEVNGAPYMVMASIQVAEIRQMLALADGKQFRVFIQSPLDDGSLILFGAGGLTKESKHPCLQNAKIRDSMPLPNSRMGILGVVYPNFLQDQEDERFVTMAQMLAVALVVLTLMWSRLLQMAMIQVRQKRELNVLYADLEDRNLKLADKVRLDPLTGLLNRGYLTQRLREVWFQQARRGALLAVIMFDVDYFKRWNDTYGHAMGDEVLRLVASQVKEHFKRHGDMVVRYGGEEFIVILLDTDIAAACKLAEELRAKIEALVLPSPLKGQVTISVGVNATVPDPGRSPEALISRADILLYQAKSLGRNRVICSHVGDVDDAGGSDEKMPLA